MTKTQLQDEIKKLEKLKDSTTEQSTKDFYDSLIAQKKEALRQLEAEEKTTGQKIGSTVGRIGGSMVGIFMGVVDDCLNGNTDKKTTQRTRGKYADGGETIGSAIGGAVEKLSKFAKGMKK